MPPAEPITRLVIGVYGDFKTAKSTIPLTFPKPLYFADFDLGFHRAIHRFPELRVKRITDITEINLIPPESVDIIVKDYYPPIKWPGQAKLSGFITAWDIITADLAVVYQTSWIKSLACDTGSEMWNRAHLAHLERAQKNAPDRSQQSLLPVEYARPNSEMRAMIVAARAFGKNLCIIHQVGGKYQDVLTKNGIEHARVGDTWDGFRHLGGLVDLIARTYKQEFEYQEVPGPQKTIKVIERRVMGKLPYLIIETCGLTLMAEDRRLNEPTFDKLLVEVNLCRAVGQAHAKSGSNG